MAHHKDKVTHPRLELKEMHKSFDKCRWEQVERMIEESIPGFSRAMIRGNLGHENIVAGRAASKHLSAAGGREFDVKSGRGNAAFYKDNLLTLFTLLTGLKKSTSIAHFKSYQEVHCFHLRYICVV